LNHCSTYERDRFCGVDGVVHVLHSFLSFFSTYGWSFILAIGGLYMGDIFAVYLVSFLLSSAGGVKKWRLCVFNVPSGLRGNLYSAFCYHYLSAEYIYVNCTDDSW